MTDWNFILSAEFKLSEDVKTAKTEKPKYLLVFTIFTNFKATGIVMALYMLRAEHFYANK
jgi:hypothetical protein